MSIYKRVVQNNKKGSISIPFLWLLLVTSLVTVSIYHVWQTNASQYQLLMDTYRLKIMLEISTQRLRKTLIFSENQMTYLEEIRFNQGEVIVTWQENQKLFNLKAILTNGKIREEQVYLEIEKKNLKDFVKPNEK